MNSLPDNSAGPPAGRLVLSPSTLVRMLVTAGIGKLFGAVV